MYLHALATAVPSASYTQSDCWDILQNSPVRQRLKRRSMLILQTILRPVQAVGFVLLPKRWIVERTFGWLGRYRRNSKDYERTIESSETMIHMSMIHLMSRRLATQTYKATKKKHRL